jgi:5-methylcytosine-specific restriction endonuclease McrA
MSALDGAVLVLNSGWSAVHIASVRRAISLVYRGIAQIVSPDDFGTYDFETWKLLSRTNGNGCVRSVSFEFRVPDIIRLCHFGGRQNRKVRFTRRNILERDNHTCQYCDKRLPASDLTLDHVIPRCRGGGATWRNLVVACLKCNDRKGSRLVAEAGMKLLRQPQKPKWSTYLAIRRGSGNHETWQKFLDSAGWDTEIRE